MGQSSDPEARHSRALEAELIRDPHEKAEAEARNGLRQYDRALEIIDYWIDEKARPFRLRVSLILDLHRAALEGISAYAGNFRPAGVEIQGSKHQPAGAHLVPQLVEDLCDYVNEKFSTATPVHLAAYTMWRLNWIYPFADGNGRTSRALSYVVLCIRLKERLPGTRTIPDFIVENRNPYFAALDDADAAYKNGVIDVSAMERLVEALLSRQLLSVIDRATGHDHAQSAHGRLASAT